MTILTTEALTLTMQEAVAREIRGALAKAGIKPKEK